MIQAARIASVLGGEKILRRRVRTLDELRKAVIAGLPKAALRHCVSSLVSSEREARCLVHSVIPEATYKRRRLLLKPEESERTERLARIIATAQYVWENDAVATRFLTTPHPLLDNERPIDVSRGELGARQVETLLWQIYYGLPV